MHIYISIESIKNDQKFQSNNKEDRLKLKDMPPQKIPQDQQVTCSKNYILIVTVLLYMLYYAKNQYFNILQVMVGYFAYANNTTKYMVENLYCIDFLITYKTVQQALQANALAINKKL